MPNEIPSRPWQKVSADLFLFDQRPYLITVDYYSSFFEVDKLDTTDSRTVIEKLKMQFSRHGIPEIVISDNGPQYASAEFASDWHFQHITTSPRNPQSNGKVESAVKICENITRKAVHGKFDPYLALLDYRNTPTEIGSSPAQRLFSRRTRNLLSLSSKQLEPKSVPQQDVQEKLISSKQKQAFYYNLKGKALPELQPGQTIRMKRPNESTWTEAVCKKMIGPCSYVVASGGRTYRRNLQQLRMVPQSDSLPVVKQAAEPLITPRPCPSFSVTWWAWFPKNSTDWRTIYHLSYLQGDSINDNIPKDPYSLSYVRSTMPSILSSLGSGAFMAKTDLKSVFHLIPIHLDDWSLLGIHWQSQYYVDMYLPFGLRSTPFLFNQLSDRLEWILKSDYGPQHVIHILDNFFIAERSTLACLSSFSTLLWVFMSLKVPVIASKTIGPSQEIEFMGIVLESVHMEAHFPQDKLSRINELLHSFKIRHSVRLVELQSVIGTLQFACKVVVPRRTFLQRAINLTRGVPSRFHHIWLNNK